MNRKIALWLLWAGFISYIVFFAPPLHLQETLTLLKNILTLEWTRVNPVILSLFSLIGIWIFIYSCLLFIDGRMQKLPFWIFAVASLGTGVIGLIPYLALRDANQTFTGTKDGLLNLLDSRNTGIVLTGFTLAVVAFGVVAGDWADFVQQFLSDRFINGMSLAFCLFAVLFPTILGDDMARRGYTSDSQIFWLIALIPLFGPLAYLCWRPPLRDVTQSV